MLYCLIMVMCSYHTHNDLCDGRGSIEDYVNMSLDMDLKALGFSSHAPLPVENNWTLKSEDLPAYFAGIESQKERVESQKERHSCRLQIYRGLEIDYIEGYQKPGDRNWDELGLDYRIGSVHSTDSLGRNSSYYCVDGSVDDLKWLIDNLYGGSVQALCEAYYRCVVQMIRSGGFDILAHLDLVKKRNGDGSFFREDSSWYISTLRRVLDILSDSGIFLEMNTGASSRGILDTVYPSEWILSESRKRNIPLVLGSDAHKPEHLLYHFQESCRLLREIGYSEVFVLLDGRWQSQALNG